MTPVREIVEATLTGKFQVLSEELEPEATLNSLDLDSLAVIELLYTVGRELGVRVGEHEVTPRNTVSELVSVVEAKLAQRAAGPLQ
ncbi:acyl carrier protein [Streptomyces sp. NPDC005202]|uniref:acyl carrier protein n=1 Tax=Streptomyces sp. NPDC005202 TaxID=3157021 RepID=UPI0033B746BB